MPKSKPFAAILKRLRESAGLSVAALAEKAGVTRQTVHDLENGRLRSGKRVAVVPSWLVVQQLAAALDTSTDTFRDC